MIDDISQVKKINGHTVFVPHTPSAREQADNLIENKLVRQRTTTMDAEKERSVPQLNTYFACCKLLSENSEDPNFVSAESVSEWVKLKLRWIDFWIVCGKQTHIKTKSISFKELKHLTACNFFDRAFDRIAAELGITVQELIGEAKSRMGK
jgi:DNA-binding XRE family transcriptional regulator